jgi:hypothetical protein
MSADSCFTIPVNEPLEHETGFLVILFALPGRLLSVEL